MQLFKGQPVPVLLALQVAYDRGAKELLVEGDTQVFRSHYFNFRQHGYTFDRAREMWVLDGPTKLDLDMIKSLRESMPASRAQIDFKMI